MTDAVPTSKGKQMDKTSLTTLAHEQLALARVASSGRSAQTLNGRHEHSLRQTVIALNAGRRLDDHDRNGEASVQVLEGRVRLVAGADSWDGEPGDLIVVPDRRHHLEAVVDSAVLLTVAVDTRLD